jgi:hypothetical protein
MRGLQIPDPYRLFTPVVGLGERTHSYSHPYGVVRAWRTESDPCDSMDTTPTLCLVGEAPDGTKTRQLQVPEGVIFQSLRERMAAVKVGALLILGRTA